MQKRTAIYIDDDVVPAINWRLVQGVPSPLLSDSWTGYVVMEYG